MARSRGRPSSRQSSASAKGQRSDLSPAASQLQREATDAEDGVEFHVNVYPDKSATTSRKRKRDETEILEQASPFDENLNQCYTIKPGKTWEKMSRYRIFTIKGQKFHVGDTIFVKTEDDDPAAPKTQQSLIPMAPELKKRWVAKVNEVRAINQYHVYVRIQWLYRPEDLPSGRLPRHGSHELIPSNDIQIIDAQTVDGVANIVHWDEFSEDTEPQAGQLYYRQSYNATSNPPKFSELRTYCTCDGHRNLNKLIVQCQNSECESWLHEECIVKQAKKNLSNNPKADKLEEDEVSISLDPDTLKLAYKGPEESWNESVNCLKCGNTLG